MSSASPFQSTKDLIIIGSSWKALLVAVKFAEQGVKAQVYYQASSPQTHTLPIHVGNGEKRERAGKAYGEPLAHSIWEFSKRNYQDSKIVLEAHGVRLCEGRLEFESEKNLKATTVDFEEFERELEARFLQLGGKIIRTKVVGFQRKAALEQDVIFEDGGKEQRVSSPIVICVEEHLCAHLFPWMKDKLVTVSLSSFVFSKKCELDFSMALFNGGADFAVSDERLWLGSYRNLYSDSAVGVQDQVDKNTLRGVREYFSSKGWIDPKETPEERISVEALPCDGLPIVGSIPELPGSYVVAGFSARAQNFFFSIATDLVRGILGQADFSGLKIFSTKRFI